MHELSGMVVNVVDCVQKLIFNEGKFKNNQA